MTSSLWLFSLLSRYCCAHHLFLYENAFYFKSKGIYKSSTLVPGETSTRWFEEKISVSFSSKCLFLKTKRTQFKDITVKYWLFTQLKNGLKMEKVDLLIQWVIEIPQTFYFTLPKAICSTFFFGNFVVVFNKNVRLAISRQLNFNFCFWLF